MRILLSITALLLSFTPPAILAAPVALIEFSNGQSELVEQFVSEDPKGYYAVEVITEITTAEPPNPKYKARQIPIGELRLLKWVPASEKHLHPELDWLYGGKRDVFHVTTLDGTIYETVGSSPIRHIAYGLAYLVGTHTVSPRSWLTYKTLTGEVQQARYAAVRNMIINDPNAISVAWSEIEAKQLERRKAESESTRQLIARLTDFRSNIKIGSETNCGPVIELKSSLVKVYSPVASYGNEHWIRRDSIFPSSYRCRFINGQYVSPSP